MTINYNLFTSRYQNWPVLQRSGLVCVGHTRGFPRFQIRYPLAGNLRQLAPASFNEVTWADDYRAQLDRLGFDQIEALISGVAGGRDAVLLCYEHVGIEGEHACHRRLFAAWWEGHTGRPVDELPDEGSLSQKLQKIVADRNRPQPNRLF